METERNIESGYINSDAALNKLVEQSYYVLSEFEGSRAVYNQAITTIVDRLPMPASLLPRSGRQGRYPSRQRDPLKSFQGRLSQGAHHESSLIFLEVLVPHG